MFLIAASVVPSRGYDAPKIGYVYCSARDNPLPTITMYSSPPVSIPVGHLNCGENVQVLGRQESWLRIASNGRDRYVPMSAISQKGDRFVAFNLPVLSAPRPKTGKALPRIIQSTGASYTEAALKARIHGYVYLALTIEADGSVHDIRVLSGLGYGLDESALKALQTWKFEPALQDGIPTKFTGAVGFSFSSPGKLP